MVLEGAHDASLNSTNGSPFTPFKDVRPNPVESKSSTLLGQFIASQRELAKYQNGQEVVIDGHTLTTAAVVAAARHYAPVRLDESDHIKERVAKSRKVIADKVESGASVYGLSTGFGGSADTRTDKPLALGNALLQHQHVGVLPTSNEPLDALPLLDPTASTAMPESWVRGAMLVRMNSLIRGHSGVRWELLEKMKEVFSANITPVVPIRSSISASGDLSPLSYIAGTLIGNPSIKVFHGPASSGPRRIGSSAEVLTQHNIEPLSLASKEPLGILMAQHSLLCGCFGLTRCRPFWLYSLPSLERRRQEVEDLRKTLVKVGAELELKISELRCKRSQHIDFIAQNLYITSPARRIPSDILSMIFQECVNAPSPHSSTHTAVTLSHVSRNWRRVALNMPRMWTALNLSIRLSDAHAEEHYAETLRLRMDAVSERSSQHPLSLSVEVHDSIPKKDSARATRLTALLNSVMESLGRMEKRWRSIRMHLRLSSAFPFPLLLLRTVTMLCAEDTEALELDVACVGWSFIPNAGWDLIATRDGVLPFATKSLTSLTIRMARTDIRRINVDYCRLTSLDFGSPATHIEFTAEDALVILHQTPNLVDCTILMKQQHIMTNGNHLVEPISLSKLQSLTLIGEQPPMAFAVALDLPSLTHLFMSKSLSPPREADNSAIVEWTRRYGTQLIEVAIAYPSLAPSALTTALENLPNLTTLQVSMHSCEGSTPLVTTQTLIQRLTSTFDGFREECLCPKLQKLVCNFGEGVPRSIIEEVLDLIRSRRGFSRWANGPVRWLEHAAMTFRDVVLEDLYNSLKLRGVDTTGVQFQSANLSETAERNIE
ncbi:hypothetical protein NMY22_g9249 [Coprinellus aureogranulatus]|nr:hypothetical protein NMY22_g9249 [Coprinellus aureogranulatus]